MCESSVFLPFFLERLNVTYWQQCPMTAMLPSVSPCITQPSWTVKSACSLSSVVGLLDSLSSFTTPLWPKPWLLCLQRCWSFLLRLHSPPTNLLLRYKVNRDDGIHLSSGDTGDHIGNGDHIIYLYCLDHSKNSLS